MRPVLALARTAVLRLLRDRSNLFFVFVFPILLIVLIGLQFGGPGGFALAVHAPDGVGGLGRELVDALDARDEVRVEFVSSSTEALDLVGRGSVSGALLVPAGYDEALRSGRAVEVSFVTTPDAAGPALRQVVASAVSDQAQLLGAATLVAATAESTFDDALLAARNAVAAVPGVAVDVTVVGQDALAEEFAGLGQFDLGASQQLALFVFVTSLSAAAALIQTREYGVAHRLLSAPVTTRTIITGELLGRFAVAALQAFYIMVGTAVVFGVRWGDPVGALLLVVAFSAVAAGVAMVLGSVLDNAGTAAGAGVGVGLGVSALGGSMVPIEIMPPVMQQVALATPHAWLLDGFADLVRRGATAVDVLPQVGVLLAMALATCLLAARLHQRTLTT